MNLCRPSLFWLIVVFAAHCRGGVAYDKKWCGVAEDDNAHHQCATAEVNAAYPRGGEAKVDNNAYCHGGAAKDDAAYHRGSTSNNDTV